MKVIFANLYFVIVFLILLKTTTAQTCLPDTSIYKIIPDTGIIIPDTLPHLVLGEEFVQVITVGVPSHRFWGPLGIDVKINWMQFKRLNNAPKGMSMLSSKGDSVYPKMNKLTWDCYTLKWKPDKIGTYTIQIIADANINTILGAVTKKDENIGEFKLIVDDNSSVNFNKTSNRNSAFCMPNPFLHNAKIIYYAERNEIAELRVFSIDGKLVHSENMNTFTGRNEFDFNGSNLNNGIYFSSIIQSGKTSYFKIVKN